MLNLHLKLEPELSKLMITSVPAQFWWFTLMSLLFAGGYYAFWFIRFKNSGKISPIPREEPPRGISPAAARYVFMGEFDSDCLLAGIINATVKNCYRINWRDDSFSIALANHSLTDTLHKEERAALSYNPAFFLKRLGVSKKKTKFTDKAEDRMQKVLKEDYGHYMVNRLLIAIIGAVISGALLLTGAFLFASEIAPELARYYFLFLPLIISGIGIFRFSLTQQNWTVLPLSIGFLAVGIMGIIDLELETNFLLSSAVLPIAVVNFGGIIKIPKYTFEGFKLLIELKEFKKFLQEKVDRTKVLAEEDTYLLPYLIAFNISFQNSHYFESLLTTYETTSRPAIFPFFGPGPFGNRR